MPEMAELIARAAAPRARAGRAAFAGGRGGLDALLADPAPDAGLLRIGQQEAWCLQCGESVNEDGFCHRCGSRRHRPVTEILQPDEYYVAR